MLKLQNEWKTSENGVAKKNIRRKGNRYVKQNIRQWEKCKHQKKSEQFDEVLRTSSVPLL
jgi:hypothetical protein